MHTKSARPTLTSGGSRAKKKRELVSTAAVQIVQAAVREDVSVAELSELANGDPAFAMRVLSVVNSAAHARNHAISNLNQAIALLGIRGLRNVALSLVVTDLVPLGEDGAMLLSQSLRRALCCRLLAPLLGEKDVDACFTTGLLLESGLLARARDELGVVAELVALPSDYRIVVESASGQVPHPQSGAELAEQYGMPASTIEAILRHHDAEPPEAVVARICWLSEKIAAVFESGIVDVARDKALEAGAGLGVGAEDIAGILEQLPALVSGAAGGFHREVGPQLDLEQLREDANARLVQLNGQLEDTVRTLRQLIEEKEDLARQLQVANRELSQLAATDALTALPNRRALEEALSRDLARSARERVAMSVVMIDVDHFKKFNDVYGHALGDEVLRMVGATLKSTAREGDVPARYGGEEFCVVFPGTSEDGALLAAERIRAAIESARVPSEKGELKVTASFGVATLPPDVQQSKEELLRRADQALYGAKEAGRNRVVAAESPSVRVSRAAPRAAKSQPRRTGKAS